MTGIDDVVNIGFRTVGWAVVPMYATKNAIPLVYHVVLRRPAPRPGTPQYQRAFQFTYSGIILLYLICNVAYVAWSQDSNYFRLLKTDVTADDAQLKTAFRKFAIRHHPDKVGEKGQEFFMRVRHAYESLLVPTKRFGYERFGPDALEWEKLTSENDYLWHGLFHSLVFYGVSLVALGVHAYLGDSGNFWQLLLFLYLFGCEMTLYFQPLSTTYAIPRPDHVDPTASALPTSSETPSSTFVSYGGPVFPLPILLLHRIFPQWLPYQLVKFARELYVAVSLALARVVPVLWPNEDTSNAANAQLLLALAHRAGVQLSSLESLSLRTLQIQLSALQPMTEQDKSTLLAGRGLAGFPDETTMDKVNSEVEKYTAEGQITLNPMLATFWQQAIETGRTATAAIKRAASASRASPSRPAGLTADYVDGTASPVSPTETARHLSPSVSPSSSPRGTRAVSLPPVTPPSRSRPSPPSTMPLPMRTMNTTGDSILRSRGSPTIIKV